MSIKKAINCFFSRLWINKSAIFKLACTYTGVVFTLWGFVSLFNPLDSILPNDITSFCKLLVGFLVLLAVFILSAIVAGFRVLCSNQVRIGESSTKNSVYVKYGDMYSPDIVEKGYNGKRAIVVSVNRCFDTIVDDQVVSQISQHGRVFQELYKSHRFTPESLNREICRILNQNNEKYETITSEDKPKGNCKRYNVGTAVNLSVNNSLSYYLLGLSYYNNHLNAQTTKADFVIAVQKLIEFCNQNSQGYPVILPLLGSKLSRTNIGLNNILHYLVDAFAINKDIINNDFYIVVWKGDKDKVSIKELRKWE
ncbi:MAG: hypothetical protein IKH59_09155 [Bacteroidaceae bacterium]|nr:hypothetical protein [Bacteroidaceae bacterium]